ncbi:hypothetical protein ACIRPU_16545 [Streptomyces sp. NPDC102259]|uniref:hypothetical protein n=1 Tax=Streptomyces sp. NPDC102259 TaxID=3366148 RepID=UPI00382F46D2
MAHLRRGHAERALASGVPAESGDVKRAADNVRRATQRARIRRSGLSVVRPLRS